MLAQSLVRGTRYHAEPLYRAVHDFLLAGWPRVALYPALFACSDEVNAETAGFRTAVLGQYGGFFTTRMIGSQVFYQQIQVALAQGHSSNFFEVNAHVGEIVEGSARRYGQLVGRDGVARATCGALGHVLEDLRTRIDEPSISQTVDGELYLDFLGTLRLRLLPHLERILSAPDPVLAITCVNLEVQVQELTRQLRRALAKGLAAAPVFVVGTISFNHAGSLDEGSVEHFAVLEGPEPGAEARLLAEP
ncbi:MAG: hypothetical protein HY906_19700 [Deltaproteobacteria bacterium]|nr:hypothetical protein [Deltaproteobacteria bacterium]